MHENNFEGMQVLLVEDDAVVRKGKGEMPARLDGGAEAPNAVWRRRTIHQPQGSNTRLAPTMRSSAMSNGVSVRWAEARAMMMKPVQMVTVTTAASRPVATAPSGRGPFFSSALRMFDARL